MGGRFDGKPQKARIASHSMSQPGHPVPRPPRPPVLGADLAVSIIALVATVFMIAGAAVLGLFSLAFLDYCPPATCSPESAVSAVGTAMLIAFGIAAVGLIVTVVQLVRRKRAWPFAVATLVLCAMTFFFGGLAYNMAVT